MHNKRMEPKTVHHRLREVANENAAEIIRRGFSAIDVQAERIKEKAKTAGIHGVDGLIEDVADQLKRKTAEWLTGVKQP